MLSMIESLGKDAYQIAENMGGQSKKRGDLINLTVKIQNPFTGSGAYDALKSIQRPLRG